MEPQQVGVGPLQTPDRLGLAHLVLEDPGRLLDYPAPVVALGGQDRLEPALADDQMLRAPDTGVRQQVLDIEQPAVDAVDLVLGQASPE